ncbi:MBL fold metallo-hydrolase [Bacillus sp. FJAT-45350]|uniref:MBL fold metallo-hydrolase n=1 Tax=Bacillus sp. FJAT-45350 TaxID=2011014 RepID=UPI000BB89307|nr:MBL fold metallo-hydrolase [Bacillus sp. FJAT-45350]
MQNEEPIIHHLGDSISLIDLMEGGTEGRTGCYVIKAEKIAIVETGTSLSVPTILAGLEKLSINPNEVEYIIVTHIHLDHSGGVGTLLPSLPNAQVIVHQRGGKHLIDPSRLIAGARVVYGDEFESLFGEIIPVPEDKIMIKGEDDSIHLGGNRTLTFYDTPGHARHHFSIYDSVSCGIFTGDTVGVRYVTQYTGVDHELILPIASPPEFDKQATLTSIAKLEKLQPKKIFHGHFGVTEPASTAFEKMKEGVEAFEKLVRELYSPEVEISVIKDKLQEFIKQKYAKEGFKVDDLSCFNLDLELNAQGLIYSINREVKS